jgi:spore maturation protein CgeB
MRIVFFVHSLQSCWNHGNAHFLRGVVRELTGLGHAVQVYEPQGAWSLENLRQEATGAKALEDCARTYPGLQSTPYDLSTLDLNAALAGADLVIVHEWNDHELVAKIGNHRKANPTYRLLFHDTHHRGVTAPDQMSAYNLQHYDGVLAFGNVLRDLYVSNGWAKQAWTWHEAADTEVFRPLPRAERDGDLVWIGNWGDDERTAELHEFLLGPVKRLGLRARVHGVRYPPEALSALADAGVEYGGWLPNHQAPQTFARFALTVHVPRRPYVEALPGIPTIRVFEALACGIPLVSAPWHDSEGLFTPGQDFLFASNGNEMEAHLRALLADPKRAQAQAAQGLATIHAHHTCRHRAQELLTIHNQIV